MREGLVPLKHLTHKMLDFSLKTTKQISLERRTIAGGAIVSLRIIRIMMCGVCQVLAKRERKSETKKDEKMGAVEILPATGMKHHWIRFLPSSICPSLPVLKPRSCLVIN